MKVSTDETFELLIGVDVGTTGARAAAFDLEGRLVHEARSPYQTSTPHEGWAEQDPDEWRNGAVLALKGLTQEVHNPGRILAIGLTGQTPTVAPFDRQIQPIGPGMLYSDNRAVEQAITMRRRIGDIAIHRRTGHLPDAFHIGPKILWLRDNEPDLFERTELLLQPRDVVLHRLTGVVATDHSHANATLLFDLVGAEWALDLFEEFALDPALFPEALASSTIAGELTSEIATRTGLRSGIPVVVGAGDSQCVAFGAGVVEPGPISEMAGASSCLNSSVTEPLEDVRVTHYRHVVPGRYTTETGVNTSGAAITWAVTRLGYTSFDSLAADVEGFLQQIGGRRSKARSAAPLFLPYLADGERDDPSARGALIGLSSRHDRAALAYSVIEGVAFAVAEKIEILQTSGSPVTELRAGGGATGLPVTGRIKADALGVPVLHLKADAAGLGVAMLAGAAVGVGTEVQAAIAESLNRAARFEPSETTEFVAERMEWFKEES